MTALTTSLDTLCINSIRMLAVDAINKSKSGHPGLPLGCAPMGYALWDKHLRHNPKNPKWFNRDRFVLSAGHGCMLLYALLHLTGYESVTIEDIKEFRQWGSRTPGHPETFETEGVEVTAGPLGAGISNADEIILPAVLLPIPIAFLQFSDPTYLFLIILLPTIVHQTIGNIIEPKIFGETFGLHPISIILSLIFWGMLWGLIGVLLAAPLTAIIKISFERFETTKPISRLLEGKIHLKNCPIKAD